MTATTTSVLIASVGGISIKPGVPVSFSITWGANISPTRWSRIWAAIESPGDQDSAQSITIQSEGSAWNLSNPSVTTNQVTLRGTGQSGATVMARVQLLTSQADTF